MSVLTNIKFALLKLKIKSNLKGNLIICNSIHNMQQKLLSLNCMRLQDDVIIENNKLLEKLWTKTVFR